MTRSHQESPTNTEEDNTAQEQVVSMGGVTMTREYYEAARRGALLIDPSNRNWRADSIESTSSGEMSEQHPPSENTPIEVDKDARRAGLLAAPLDSNPNQGSDETNQALVQSDGNAQESTPTNTSTLIDRLSNVRPEAKHEIQKRYPRDFEKGADPYRQPKPRITNEVAEMEKILAKYKDSSIYSHVPKDRFMTWWLTQEELNLFHDNHRWQSIPEFNIIEGARVTTLILIPNRMKDPDEFRFHCIPIKQMAKMMVGQQQGQPLTMHRMDPDDPLCRPAGIDQHR